MFDSEQELIDLYQQVILDHSRNPRNFRKIEDASHDAEGFNPLCGDQIHVFIKIKDGNIDDLAFEGNGCAICTASASIMTQNLKGQSVAKANQTFKAFHKLLTKDEATEPADLGKLSVFSGVRKYPIRVKCATLPWHTLVASMEGSDDSVTTE